MNKFGLRKLISVAISSVLGLGVLIGAAAPARALTVTLGASDSLIFNHSGTGNGYTNIVGDGKANGDVVLYKKVVSVGGIDVDAVLTTTLTNASISVYDSPGSASTNESNFQFNGGITAANYAGYITINFSFYEAGTYTGVNTGNPVVLQNVRMTAIDLDGSGAGNADFQFAEFTGIQKYTLNNPTALTVSNPSAGKVRFTATSDVNGSSRVQDQVLAKFDSVQNVSVSLGNVKVAATNYFGIAFTPWSGGTPIETTNSYNTPPTSSSTTTNNVTAAVPYVLPKSVFGSYADVDGNPFNQVIIKTLPASGTLEYLNGGVWTAVTANQVITVADIDLGKLRYTPGASGTTASLTFQVHDGLAYSTATYTATFNSRTAAQTIVFNNPGAKAPGVTFDPLAVSNISSTNTSTGLTVTLTSKTPGVCTVSGSNITTVSAGMCEIEATQPGDSTYGAAAPVTQIFPVSTGTSQSITFNNPLDKSISVGTVTTTPTATSGLPVTLTSLTPSVCTVSGGVITLVSKGVCQIKATQPGNGTYAPASPVIQTFNVTAIQITITAPAVTVYYGDPIPALSSPTFSNGWINGDTSAVLTSQPTCTTTYTSTTDVTAGATTTCSGAAAANYTFIYVSTPVTINKAAVVITASSTSVEYGSAIPTITPSYSGFKNSDGAGAIDTAPTCTTTYDDAPTPTNAGASTTTSCSGAVDVNYSFTYVGGSVTITKATVTVTASSHSVSTGASTPTITASYSGWKNSQDSSVLTTTPTCSTTYTSSATAGNYNTACTSAAATNYNFNYVTGLVVASAASGATSQTITFTAPTDKTYGPSFNLSALASSNAGSFPTADSNLAVTVTSNSPSVCTVSGNVVTIVGVGTCSLSANQGGGIVGSTTYNPAATVTITFAINRAPLTVTAGNITVTYGDPVPSVTHTITGYVLSQNSSALITLPVCVTTYVATDSVSASRTTSCSGAAALNYSFSYVAGTVTINKATLSIRASSHTVLVGDAAPSITATYVGFKNGDTSSVIGGSQSCSTVYDNTKSAGSYASSCSGGTAANYTLNYVNGTVIANDAVSILNQTIAFPTPNGKTYGNTPFNINPSATSGLNVEYSSDTPDVCVIENGKVKILAAGDCSITATQPGNFDYLAAPPVTINFTIGKASLRVTASSHTVTQGSAKPSIGAGYSGFVNGDNSRDISGIGCSSSYSETSAVGSYTTSCSGGRSDNYTFTYINGVVSVTEATPTPTRTLGTPTPTPTPTETVAGFSNLPTPEPIMPTGPDGKPLADLNAPATIDLGDGKQTSASSNGVLLAKNGSSAATRTLSELGAQALGGFAPGVGIRIEVIGAKTTGQFVVTSGTKADPIAIAAALEESTSRTAVNFAKIKSVNSVITPDQKQVIVGEPTKDAIDTFAASDLENPLTVGQLGANKATKWLKVQASVDTYKPGSVVYLAVTTQPVIFGAAVVDKYGKADFTGLLPVDVLSSGGHNIRVVGIRDLDGVTTDETGEIQLANETLAEIERFDPGTKATVKVIGANNSGGLHAVIREVPLMKYEPWWTVWLAAWTAFLLLLARRYGKVLSANEKTVVTGLMTIATIPALYLGWTSSTYAIMFWGAVFGALGIVGLKLLPIKGSVEDREARKRIKQKMDQFEDQVSDKIDEIKDRLDD